MERLTVAAVKETGSYVGKPVDMPIKWDVRGKNHEAIVSVKLRAYDSAISDSLHEVSGIDPMVSRIVSSIVDESGQPVFTVKDIVGNEKGEDKMCASLFIALILAINEANGFNEDEDEIKNE